ncbi:MAG: diaminohydroxyphosphoribosylaminopyrimidine deaminase [Oceanicoccus sp.]|jgi:diaminohydroxyphosphoribosylaminopyrimidine deaminase/5-amino-6-(5-phosphoribosylamino)uracil reductase
MRRALRLAEKGRGFVLPNPMVGAVIVKNDERIGEGFHHKHGDPHAEVMAINSCEQSLEGATIYVTLEPCDHVGKTSACTEAIIKSGIKKIIIASKDPSRNGAEVLKAAGLEVEIGLLGDQAKQLNREFFTFHEKKRPFITLKAALSLDGKIAKNRDSSTQLTSQLAQKLTHVMRHQHHAILVGAGTVIADDPHLGVRLIEGRDPLRLVWKGERDLDPSLQIFRDENHKIMEAKNLENLFKELYEMGVVSVLVEGGSTVHSQFINEKAWDEMKVFYAPRLLGNEAVPFFEGESQDSFKIKNVRQCGPDLLLTATPSWDLDPS